MKRLNTALLLCFALGSAQALASNIKFNCVPPEFPAIPAGDQILFQCDGKGISSTPNYWGKHNVANHSFIQNQASVFINANNILNLKSDGFLLLDKEATLTFQKDAALYNEGTLNLSGNAKLIFLDRSYLTMNGQIMGDSSGTISFSDDASLHIDKGFQETPSLLSPHWSFDGDNKIFLMESCTTCYTGGLPDRLLNAINEHVTLTTRLPGTFDDRISKNLGYLIINAPQLQIRRWAKKTEIYQESNVFYNGNQKTETEHLILPDSVGRPINKSVQLTLTQHFDELNLSQIQGTRNYIYLTDNDTHITGFSGKNYVVIAKNQWNAKPHIHYYGKDDNGLDHVLLLGSDVNHPAILEFNTSLPVLDLSKLPNEATATLPQAGVAAGGTYQIHGVIKLAADQLVTRMPTRYNVDILPGVTMTWPNVDLAPLIKLTEDGQNVLRSLTGHLRLTAKNATWGTDSFMHVQPTVVFSTDKGTSNTQTIADLPYQFGVDANTRLVVETNHVHVSGDAIQAEFVNGTVYMPLTFVDFANWNSHWYPWEIKAGHGHLEINTADFKHPEAFVDKTQKLLKNSAKTISVVLKGPQTLDIKGKKYRYVVGTLSDIKRFKDANDPNKTSTHSISSRAAATDNDIYLTLVRDLGVVPPSSSGSSGVSGGSTLLQLGAMTLAQPAIEAQIRLDATRLNRDLWHAERNTRQGLYTWVKAIGTYQSADTEQSDVEESASALGFNLGAEYQWPVQRGQQLAVSVATEWLGGTRKVGDNSYQEQRWNTALGLRWQKQELYAAVSTQWANVSHESTGNTPSLSSSQLAFEVSAEMGMKLHLSPVVDVTPFAQYNWTHFDSQHASSSFAQQHLQLGAYLTVPYANPDVTLSNKFGVSTLISLLANDRSSFQAYWNLRLSSSRLSNRFSDNLGLQVQTTLEYAPSDNRTGLAVSVGADYAF